MKEKLRQEIGELMKDFVAARNGHRWARKCHNVREVERKNDAIIAILMSICHRQGKIIQLCDAEEFEDFERKAS
jgi:hypothetical protein